MDAVEKTKVREKTVASIFSTACPTVSVRNQAIQYNNVSKSQVLDRNDVTTGLRYWKTCVIFSLERGCGHPCLSLEGMKRE